MSCVVMRGCLILSALLAGAAAAAAAQTVTPGTREIWQFNFASLPVGDFPVRRDLSSNSSLEVVDKNGIHMLRAGTPSDFVISLPETLPETFTLEFDLVPQESGNSDNLSFKGTRDKGKSTSSAEVFWSPASHRVVGGGDPDFHATTPNPGQTLASQLSLIVASIEGTTIKLYTNNVRLYTVDDRRFARGQVLRVSLGGTDDGKGAVYLARVRVAEGAATMTPVAAATGPTGAVGAVTAVPATQTGTITPLAPPPPPSLLGTRSTGASIGPTGGGNPVGAATASRLNPLPPRRIQLIEFAASGGQNLLPPRTLALSAFSATGTLSVTPLRSISLPSFTATGVQASPSPRTVSLPTFSATGLEVIVTAPTHLSIPGPRIIALSMFHASGVDALAPRVLALTSFSATGLPDGVRARTIAFVRFTASGTAALIPPRIVRLPSFTATGGETTP